MSGKSNRLLDPKHHRHQAVLQFVHDMIQNQLMDELGVTPEQVQELLTNEALRLCGFKHLAPPLVLVDGPHKLRVVGGWTLAQRINLANFGSVNSTITEARFPRAVVEESYEDEFYLLKLTESARHDRLMEEVEKRGLVPATLPELISFTIEYPSWGAMVGAPLSILMADATEVPYTSWNDTWSLRLWSLTETWEAGIRFLCRKTHVD